MSTRRKRQPPRVRHHVDVPDDGLDSGRGHVVGQVPVVVPASVVVTDWDRLVALVDQGDDVAALELVPSVTQELRALTRRSVSGVRQEGASWAAVGALLGVTRQAAWERFGQKR